MRMRLMAAAALLTSTLAACGDGGTGPGDADPRLSQAELAAMNRAILGVGTGVAETGAASASSARASRSDAGAPGTGGFAFTFDNTVPCPPGGTVRAAGVLNGAWNGTAQTAELSSDFAVTHATCGVQADDGGVIRINGSPDIDFTLRAAANASGLTSLVLTEKGAFTWDRGAGNSGTCTVDVTAELIPATGQVRLTGTFCGWNVTGVTEAA